MKVLFALLFVTCISFTAQDDVKTLLCDKKWYTSYARVGDRIEPIPKEVPLSARPAIMFHKNGVFEHWIEGEHGKGTWSYNPAKREITTTEKGIAPEKIKLIRITKEVLEIKNGDEIYGFRYDKK